MRKAIILLTTLGLSWMANSQEYIVEAKLYKQDKLIGTPTLMVNENERATIAVNSLIHNYQLSIMLNEIDNNSVKVATNIRIGKQTVSPEIVITYGEEASIVIEQEKLSLIVRPYNMP